MLPTWLFLFCAAAALWAVKHPGRMLAAFVVSCVLGASAALEVVLMGGAPVTPALFLVPFLLWVALRDRGWFATWAGASLREPGGWLLLFVAWAVLTAGFMPRLFEGEFLVYTTSRAAASDLGVQLAPLRPNSTNATQSIYLIVGCVTFLATRSIASAGNTQDWIVRGVFAAALLNLGFAVMHAISALGGVELGLSYIRNANYAIVNQAVGGWPRIQGSFSEPAALAGFTVVIYGFLLALWLRGVRTWASGALALSTGAVLVLTLSTTALVALALVTLLGLSVHGLRELLVQRRARFGGRTVVLLLILVVACALLLWNPPWLRRLADIVWAMVVDKAQSDSAVERLSWVSGTWSNFRDTYGLGAGAGSARGSSYPLVVLGNTGVPGAVAMTLFLGLLFFKPVRADATPGNLAVLFACRMGLAGSLTAATLSATMIDLGPTFYVMAGLTAGLVAWLSRPAAAERAGPVPQPVLRPRPSP